MQERNPLSRLTLGSATVITHHCGSVCVYVSSCLREAAACPAPRYQEPADSWRLGRGVREVPLAQELMASSRDLTPSLRAAPCCKLAEKGSEVTELCPPHPTLPPFSCSTGEVRVQEALEQQPPELVVGGDSEACSRAPQQGACLPTLGLKQKSSGSRRLIL